MGPYDPVFDRNNDGKLDFFEEYERQDFDDMLAKRGIYEEAEEDAGDAGICGCYAIQKLH